MSSFENRLKEAAKLVKVEYSQTAIGKSLEISKQTIDRWMAGSVPAPDTLFYVADKWGVDPRWLATGEGEPRPKPKPPAGLHQHEETLLRQYRGADPRWQLALRLLAGLATEDQLQAASDINLVVARLLGMKPKDIRYPTDTYVEKKLGLPPGVKKTTKS